MRAQLVRPVGGGRAGDGQTCRLGRSDRRSDCGWDYGRRGWRPGERRRRRLAVPEPNPE